MKKLFSILGFILLAVLAISCIEPWEEPAGKFSISFGGTNGSARSLYEDREQLTFTIKLSNGPGADQSKGDIKYGQTVNFSVVPGRWDIYVAAWLEGELKAEHSQSKVIKPGRNDPVKITMDEKGNVIVECNHQWGDWEITPATCMAEGLKTRTCTLDPSHGETQVIPIDENAHDYSEETVEATCKDDGETKYTCRLNGNHTHTVEIPKNEYAHNIQSPTFSTAATCETEGEEHGACNICGGNDVTKKLYALGHDYEWEITQEANFTKKMKETETCTRDKLHTRETREVGDTLPYFSNAAELGEYLADYDSPTSTTNPYRVNLRVNDVSDLTNIRDALGGATGTKYVYLDLTGSTIETIPTTTFGTSATDYTAALVGVKIPDGVITIGNGAFAYCANLASVIIPNGVTTIGAGVFSYSGITSITIPASVTSIGANVFRFAPNLTRVVFETGSDIAAANFGTYPIQRPPSFSDNQSLRGMYLEASPKAGAFLIEEYEYADIPGTKMAMRLANTITLPAANITTLTEGVWADGNLPANGEQLYKFTATVTGTQYIQVSIGTLSLAIVGFCGSDGYGIAGRFTFPSDGDEYISLTVTMGETYYITVTPYSSVYSGTYEIAFNTSSTPPAITLPSANVTTLNEGAWEDGNIPQNGEQWFTFTATVTGTQYIHVYRGTLTDLYVNVYNSSGTVVGSKTRLYTNSSTNRTVTIGETYYIWVRPYSSSYSGTYKIAFNQSTTAPAQ